MVTSHETRPRLAPFVGGVLAALAGSAAGHLVAAVTVPASSPVLAVGTEVINLTPTPVKTWAVRTLGSNDKPVLVGSVLVVTLLLAGLAGVLAARRFAVGAALLTVLVALAGVFAVVQPTAGVVDVLPAVATLVVGLLVLRLLVTRATRATRPQTAGPSEDARPAAAASSSAPASSPPRPSSSAAPASWSAGRAARSPTSCCPRRPTGSPRRPLGSRHGSRASRRS